MKSSNGLGRGPVARLALVLMLSAILVQPAVTFKLSSIFKDAAAGVCATGVGVTTVFPCGAKFQEYIKPFKNENGEVPVSVACCAMTTFRYCITDDIEKYCGSGAEKVVDSTIKSLVGTIKLAGGQLACDGDEFYYRKESPLCWPVWSHGIAAVLILLLVLITCCVCCKTCCCPSTKKNRPVVVNLLPIHDPSGNPPPYTRLPNQDLTSSLHE